MSNKSTDSQDSNDSSLWRTVLKGIEVRLRFFLAIGILASVATGWPWVRASWDAVWSLWSPNQTDSAVSADTEFFCPMDPGVVSGWPAICPICNMDLITRKKSDAKLLPEGVVSRMQISPYRVQLAGIRTVPVSSTMDAAWIDAYQRDAYPADGAPDLVIPSTAVIRFANDRIVYVETMPGMFDGVLVEVGEQAGPFVSVKSGLKIGQHVVATAAFLVDAESRLNASFATQYFGAGSSGTVPPLPPKKAGNAADKELALEGEDLALVLRQKTCPVTDEPLGSMGTPLIIIVEGRKIAICCKGCEDSVREAPSKYFAKIDSQDATLPDSNRP